MVLRLHGSASSGCEKAIPIKTIAINNNTLPIIRDVLLFITSPPSIKSFYKATLITMLRTITIPTQNVTITFFSFPLAFTFSSIFPEKIATIIAAIIKIKYSGIIHSPSHKVLKQIYILHNDMQLL